jgi:ribosome-binding factor A
MEKAPTQRQLKVGESIRRSLSEFFMRGEIPYLDGISITVSEVKISPDLQNATAYIMPLGGKDADIILKVLAQFVGLIRTYVSKDVKLRTAPRISFRLDNSYEEAAKIAALLSKIEKK